MDEVGGVSAHLAAFNLKGSIYLSHSPWGTLHVFDRDPQKLNFKLLDDPL